MSSNSISDMVDDTIKYSDELSLGEEDKVEFSMTINKVKSSVPTSDNDIVNDYKKARNILYSLSAVTQKALENAMSMSMDVIHPRSFEVVNQLISTMKDLAKDLVGLQSQYQKVLEIQDADDGEDIPEDQTNNDSSLEDLLNEMDEMEKKVKGAIDGKGQEEQKT